MAQRTQRGKRKDERSTEDRMALSVSGNTNCKMWMSMMVPDEVDNIIMYLYSASIQLPAQQCFYE